VTSFGHLLRLLAPRWRVLTAIAALMGVLAGTTAAYAWAAGPLLGAFYGAEGAPWPAPGGPWGPFQGDPATQLTAMAGLLALITLLRAIARYGHDVLVLQLEQDILLETRLRLHRHLLALPALGTAGGRHGEMGSRVTTEVERLRMLIRLAVAGLGRNGASALALLGLAFAIDAPLTGLALLAVPALGLVVHRLAGRARVAERAVMRAQSRLSGLASEMAAMRPLLRAYDAEDHARALFEQDAQTTRRAAVRASRIRSLLGPSLDVVGAAGIVLALVVAQGRLAAGALSPQAAVSLIAALVLLYRPLQSLATIAQGLSVGLAAIDRILEVLALPAEPADAAGAVEPPEPVGSITLDSVHAGYGPEDVLRGLHLTIRAGESVAIVGISGAGKTTLFLLLMGLLRPRRGEIRVDGAPLATVRQDAWRRRLAWVPQEPLIFADTVLANIALGEARPDPVRAEAAARAAAAHGFIARLPQDYGTVLDEGGRNLSMGERQRLCLARALYRDAPLLLLDEPTAALDGEAEGAFSDTIAGLMGDRTVLLASHRESTVRHVDRVVVLADGRVVDQGSPAELAGRGGPYRALFPDGATPRGATASSSPAPRAIGSRP
jgi:ABC-type multidrug transport system fused ATPase/permease subunit